MSASFVSDIPILMYHRVSNFVPRGTARMTVSCAEFECHLAAITRLGFSVITVSELAALRRSGQSSIGAQSIVITFDDGFQDFYKNALPILRSFGLRSTLYLTSGLVGRKSIWLKNRPACDLPLMNWEEVARCAEAGVEIGGHTMRHPRLDQLRHSALEYEIQAGKLLIESRLGACIQTFAYPFGLYNKEVRDAVAAAGFESACAVNYRVSRSTDNIFSLPRVQAESYFDVKTFDLLSLGKIPLFPSVMDRTRHRLWRALRGSMLSFTRSLR